MAIENGLILYSVDSSVLYSNHHYFCVDGCSNPVGCHHWSFHDSDIQKKAANVVSVLEAYTDLHA